MQLSAEAIAALSAYSFRGNVRELRNLVERLAILCDGPRISGTEAEQVLPRAAAAVPAVATAPSAEPLASLPPAEDASAPQRTGVDRPFRDQVQDAEREIILNALAFTRDNVTEAAKLLDLERGHFYKKMKALGLRRGGAGDKEGE
jgi:two-component system nitrogen regulation response regulator NtrX